MRAPHTRQNCGAVESDIQFEAKQNFLDNGPLSLPRSAHSLAVYFSQQGLALTGEASDSGSSRKTNDAWILD